MANAERPHRLAIVVHQARSDDDFIAAVAIHIGHADCVSALAVVLFLFVVRVPSPYEIQVRVVRLDHNGPIGSSLHQQMRPLAIKIGDGQHVAAVIVVLADFRQPRNPRDLLDDLARPAVELVQPLRPGLHVPFWFARVAFTALAVDFRFAVAVDIVRDVRCVPRTRLDGPTHVVSPEETAVQRVGFELVRIGALFPISGCLVWIRVEVRLLNDQFISAVTVEVSSSYLVDAIVALQLDGNVRLAGRCAGRCGTACSPGLHRRPSLVARSSAGPSSAALRRRRSSCSRAPARQSAVCGVTTGPAWR